MNLRAKLKQLTAALEFANADTFREFEQLLESREGPVPAPIPRHAAGRGATARRARREERTTDFHALARRAVLKPSGQY